MIPVRVHRLLALVLIAVTASTLLNAAPAGAAIAYFQLAAFNGMIGGVDKCASVGGASLANGAPLVSWSCVGGAHQTWRWTGNDEIINSNSGKCLAIGSASKDAGARAIQWTCNGGREQKWVKTSAGAGEGWILRNLNSGYVLSVSGDSDANGTWIVQWGYSGSDGQKWEERHI
ncbi:RICIN domain-containing protein [Phytohabitans rumicis]|nr:RICIN domain-containing protein [Phytohabitans rumicis]